LYKVQLENAQKKIYRAQEDLSTVDHQRQAAEEDAARAHTTALALNEEKLIQMAQEEGRRMGWRRGCNVVEILATRRDARPVMSKVVRELKI
jgi:hypothetical protein